jgi:hypothetical protein
MRYGPAPVTADGAVPPVDAEVESAGAPRLMDWMTPTPGFQAEEDAVAAGTLDPALVTGAPDVVLTATGGGGS